LDVKAPAGGAGDPERPSLNRELAALERHLSGALGLEVEMTTKGGQGAVQISFANIEQLECIARHLSSFDVHSEPQPTCPGLAA
jgi:ParB family chromosome partitioning protein